MLPSLYAMVELFNLKLVNQMPQLLANALQLLHKLSGENYHKSGTELNNLLLSQNVITAAFSSFPTAKKLKLYLVLRLSELWDTI